MVKVRANKNSTAEGVRVSKNAKREESLIDNMEKMTVYISMIAKSINANKDSSACSDQIV